MDINGAKALKRRLGLDGADEAAVPVAAPVDVPDDAPPVYHWTGKAPPEMTPPDAEEEAAPRRASLFSWLAPNFR